MKKQKTKELWKFIFLSILSIVLTSVGIWLLEFEQNKRIQTFFDGLWWTICALTPIGPEIILKNEVSKIFAVITFIINLFLFLMVFGRIIGFSLMAKNQEFLGHNTYLKKNHIVLINWSAQTKSLIPELGFKNELVLIDEHLEFSPFADEAAFFYVRGDPTTIETLKRANLVAAKKLIILSKSNHINDHHSILTALAAKDLNPKLPILVEIIHADSELFLQKIGCESIVNYGKIFSKLVSQEVRTPGISSIFEEINNTYAGMTLQKLPLEKKWFGKTFKEFSFDLKENLDILILGIERQNKSYLNPPNDFILNLGDFYFCFKGKNIF